MPLSRGGISYVAGSYSAHNAVVVVAAGSAENIVSFAVALVHMIANGCAGKNGGIVVSSISFIGFYLILLLSGVDKIPITYQEAAAIDGAGDIVCFFRITLPLLRDVLVISISLWIINAIKYFELIWAMFKGANSSVQTLGTYMFSMAFGVEVPIFKLGYGAAISVVMFLMVAVLVGVFRRVFDRDDLQY